MKEHLCRIQLSEMKRLFVDEASHARILSAKYCLDDEIGGLEVYADRRNRDRRMGLMYHRALDEGRMPYVNKPVSFIKRAN